MEKVILTKDQKYRAVIMHDDCPINPFEDWDTLPAVISRSGYNRGLSFYGEAVEYAPEFAKAEFVANWQELQGIFNCKFKSLLSFARWLHGETCRDYIDVLESFNDLLTEHILYNCSDLEKLDTLETPYNCKSGFFAYRTLVRCYSQGDWAELLLYYTPEMLKRWGTDYNREELKKRCTKQRAPF